MYETLASQVYSQVKEEIFEGVYFENDLLSESQIAKEHGVSKTTAREALSILCQEGLLHKVPNKGYFVRRTLQKDYDDRLWLRFFIEKGTMEWIIDNIADAQLIELRAEYANGEALNYENFYRHNRSFHTDLVSLMGNEQISSVHDDLMRFLQRPGIYRKSRRLPEITARHLALIDAIIERNLDKANSILREDVLGDLSANMVERSC